MSLVPILLVAGLVVAAGAFGLAVSRRRRSADAARAYLKGFHYILSDEPDAALEQRTRAGEVDARTIETYFALGALFRRTGEHERAIRLHQNMLLKAGSTPELLRQVRMELALDYQRAGMLERAGETFQQVLEEEPTHKEALTRLRQVYEVQQEHANAAEIQGRLVEKLGGSRAILAHLLAEAALAEKDGELALRFAERAVSVEEGSAHGWLALGLVHLAQGRPEKASEALQKAVGLDPELAVRAADPLIRCMGPDRALAFYQEQAEPSGHPSLRVALARCLHELKQIEKAIASLREAVELDPRYVEARVQLGRALLESNMGEATRSELESLLSALGQREPGFVCRSCGHGFTEPQFRCDRCLSWDTVRRGTVSGPHPAPVSAG